MNGLGEMTATDQYKTSDTTMDGMSMIRIVGIGAENTTVIGMITIIPPTIAEGVMTNEENMQIWIGAIQTGRDIGTTGAIIGGEICREMSVENQQETINGSPIET